MSGGIYETLFPDGPVPAPVAAKKPVSPPTPFKPQIPITHVNPVSQVPPAVWKNLRQVSQLPQHWDIRHSFLVAAFSLLIIGAAAFSFADRPHPAKTTPQQAPMPVTPPAEKTEQTAHPAPPSVPRKKETTAPVPSTVTTAMASWPSFGNAAFNDATRARTENVQDVRALQEHLRSFGIFKDTASGTLDKPTRKAFAVLASLSGRTVSDIPSAMAALDAANAKVDAMLPYVGQFPLGNDVPSWLLASLTENDLNAISEKFNSLLAQAPGPFSLTLTDPALELHGQLLPDPERQATSLTCVGFTLLFAKGPLHQRVISRACRNPSSWGWRLAPT